MVPHGWVVHRARDPLVDQWGLALAEAVRRGERDESPPREVSPALRPALERALSLDRARRFASLGELLPALG